MIQGAADTCDAPSESEGLDQYFTAGYQRLVLEGVGHFPHREAPEAVAAAILQLVAEVYQA
jgi:pimeloyl-ACP methyl ester carboxylesterase